MSVPAYRLRMDCASIMLLLFHCVCCSCSDCAAIMITLFVCVYFSCLDCAPIMLKLFLCVCCSCFTVRNVPAQTPGPECDELRSGLTDDEAKLILNTHNDLRCQHWKICKSDWLPYKSLTPCPWILVNVWVLVRDSWLMTPGQWLLVSDS